MMDLKFKGPKWVGNIYQKFEAICHEVDDIVKQDTFKYVENQMQSVGKNVKKLCSDLLPPLGQPNKHVAEDMASEKIATVSTDTRKSLQENSVDALEKQSPTEPDDPVDKLSSPTSTDTLVESDFNLPMGKVDDIMTNETWAADDEEIAKPILSKLTSSGGEESFSESSVGVFIQSNHESRQADSSQVDTSTDEFDCSEQKSRPDYLFEEVECVSGFSTVMVSTTDTKVMDSEHQLNLFSSQYHLSEQLSSPASMDTLQGSKSNLCLGKTDGILTNASSDANNGEFPLKAYAPVLSESNSLGMVEHFTMSPIGVFNQTMEANTHADLSKDEPETSAHEVEFESLQNWTLCDDYVDKIECIPDALNSTSEMSFSVVSVENTTEDAGLASFSRSIAEESLRISGSSPEKLTQEAIFCHNSIEGVNFASNFSDAAHETSAHSLECQLLDSTAWDDFADETGCVSGGSSTCSEMVYSVVSGDTSIENIGVTSFDCSNAKLGLSEDLSQNLSKEAMLCHNSIEAADCVCDMSEVIPGVSSAHGLEFEVQLSSPACDEFDNQCVSDPSKATSEVVCSFVSREDAAVKIGVLSFSGSNAYKFHRFTKSPPQMLSEEATFTHSSGGKAGCVSNSSDGSSLSASVLTVSSKNKDTEGLLSSFSSVLSVEGTSRSMETVPLPVPCGKQQVKICKPVQHEAAITSSDTGCLDESSSDIAYCHMESIDLHDKVQIQENCVNVEDSVLRAISRRARKQRSYKKQIQDAFTSRKRLVKEYEQLAIWFGDVGLDSSQETKDNSGTHQAGDSEWELL